jgi:hypothetical protein
MIDRPPEYRLTCNCGMKITGTNEKGLLSLIKKHIETGEYHLGHLSLHNYKAGETELEKIVDTAISAREKNDASTTG